MLKIDGEYNKVKNICTEEGQSMETTEKNRFSILLEQLINMGEVKNSSLATALRYDPSYISKWITGRILPAEKTKQKVLRGTARKLSDRARRAGWKR